MSWQEELRKLDEELASGRLSADDYRVRRDQVLSSAVAPGETPGAPGQQPQQNFFAAQPPSQPQQPPAQPGYPQQPAQQQPPQPNTAEATQVVAPVSPPQGVPQAGPEATQIVAPASVDPAVDRTQAVPRWQTQAPQQPQYQQPGYQQQNSPAGGFAQPGYPQQQQQPGPHSGGFQQQQQQQPAWNQAEDIRPPWGGDQDYPAMAPSASSEWTQQGPELFEESDGKGKGGKVALLAIIALLVVGGLVTGGIFLFSGDETPSAQPTNTQPVNQPAPAPPTKSTPKTVDPSAPLIERIPQTPGQQDPANGKLEVDQLAVSKVMTAQQVEVLKTNGASEAAWRGSVKGADENSAYPDRFSTTAVRFADTEKATTARTALTTLMDEDETFIHVTDSMPNIPSDVRFYKQVDAKKAEYFGVWVSGDVLVQVHVSLDPLPSPAQDAEAAMSGSYQRTVIGALANFPVTGGN